MNELDSLKRFTSKEAYKPSEIKEICLKDGKAVATDTYVLAEIETGTELESWNAKGYPDYQLIFPEKENTILLNVNYLYQISLFLKRHGITNIELQPQGKDKPIILYSETKDGRKIRAAIMPIMQ